MACTLVVEGLITQDMFNAWILNSVIPHCSSRPGPQSVVVMDDAAIHCSEVSVAGSKSVLLADEPVS